MPRRNVRRGRAFLVMIIVTSSSETAVLFTMPRMIDEKRIVLRPRVAHDRADRGRVVVLDAAPERVGQQLFGERADEQLRPAQQRRFEPVDVGELAAVGQACRTRRSARRLRPCASGRPRRSSRARSRPDPSGCGTRRRRRWSGARPAARAPTRLPSTVLSLSAGTFGSGGGGGMPSRLSRTHLPRSTGDVRVAYEVTVRMLP